MRQYLDLLEKVIKEGEKHDDRTGVGTVALFGEMLTFDLRRGFPLLTTKKVNFNAVKQELLWFLRGETNIKTLGNHIWDEWADENGEVGPVYGKQWVDWETFDIIDHPNIPRSMGLNVVHTGIPINQVQNAIDMIKKNPNSRRIIVTAWNPADLPHMRLPVCHILYQFKVIHDQYLDMIWYQRSCDMGLGVPFNIASYALLQSMVANECRLQPRFLKGVLADCHVYSNHIYPLKEQLKRIPKNLPILDLAPHKGVFDITEDDIKIKGYWPHPPIKLEVAV